MNIILTSTGFENAETLYKLRKMINIPFEKLKMLVIPIARKYEYNQKKYLTAYINLGFKEENIYFFNDETPDLYRNLHINLLYVCGGNTFLLKDCLQKANFEKDIIRYIRERGNIFRRKRWNPCCHF